MRRKEKEIVEHDEIMQVLGKCAILNLAIHDGEYPYAITVNFAHLDTPDGVIIYFHGAAEGKKPELLKKNGKVGFITYHDTRIVIGDTVCGSTREYESICGYGDVEILQDDEEKQLGLRLIISHLGDPRKDRFDMDRLNKIVVYKLRVKELSCKRSSKATSVEGLRKANMGTY